MTIETILLLLVALQVKHLLADYVWQSTWMVKNKGIYGHPAGLAHAGMHGVFTLVVLVLFGTAPLLALVVSAVEFAIHYHIDWTKDQLTRRRDIRPDQRLFWVYHGVDQFCHQVTLVGVVTALLWFA